ncbi:MAG: hypothetical protein N2Z85_00575 [Patescibacteria group bacterium]|nr:hypothetical protein [Patescibacteria group bacterium]
MNKKGKLIILEGTDGSGKTTQLNLLVKKLKQKSIKFKTFDFPQYNKESSYFIKKYLNGEYGTWKEVGPYKTSIFYALDRFDVGQEIKNWLNQGYLVISNRYTASNLAHQGSKIKSIISRKKFFNWVLNFEHNILEIPRPNLNIVLYMPAEIAQKLVDQKGDREYLKRVKRDIHEADLKYLKNTEKVYLDLIKLYPLDFKKIDCFLNNKILSPEEINQKIWKILEKFIK